MSISSRSHQILGRRGLDRLRDELSGRDVAIVGQVAELRLLTAAQIKAVHFPIGERHRSELSATRVCQVVLARLVRDRLLIRLDRRQGGIRAGSSGFTYALGPVGHRLVVTSGPRRRFQEPTSRFLDHTLAIAQLVVDLTTASRAGKCEILTCQPEPRCHRQYSSDGGWLILKPDLFVSLGVDEYEHRWFVEVDLDSESIPTLLRKSRMYERYYQSGKEQEAYGVFPRVCWIVPTARRAEQLRRRIASDSQLTDRLFTVTTVEHALEVLQGVTL